MKNIIQYLFLFFLFLGNNSFSANDPVLDSLNNILQKIPPDTSKINLLNAYSASYRSTNAEYAIGFANQAIALSEQIGSKKLKAKSLISKSNVYRSKSDYETAIQFNTQVLQIYESLGEKEELAKILVDIGGGYWAMGKYSNALSYFIKSLEIREALKDTSLEGKRYMAQSYNNVGSIYYKLNDFDKSLNYFNNALKLREETRDSSRIADYLNNIAAVYLSMKNNTKALDFYNKSMEIRKTINDKSGIANSLNNIGDLYREQHESDKALRYYQESQKIIEELGNRESMPTNLNNIGMMYAEQKKYDKALEYSGRSLKIAEEINSLDDIKTAYESLAEIHSKNGNFSEAYRFHILYSAIKDSIFNKESAEQVAEMQTKYETEKKEKEIELLNKDKEIQSSNLKTQKLVTYSVIGGMVLVILMVFLIYNRYRLKQKANEKLEAAYKEIADKNKDITDSIQYAKRIQEAILPAKEKIQKIFPQSFVLYKPRDIVSGDFYWFAEKKSNGQLSNEKINKVVVAVADCTGHGVPGAFMSMIGNTSLNQIVNEKEILQPSLILDNLNQVIREALKQDEELSESRDGMDVAICSIDFDNNELEFAGAYRPMYYFHEGKLTEFAGDRFPVAGFHVQRQRKFTNQKIQYKKGDIIYIFTDGYGDQFGGANNRKFMTKRFKDLLIGIHSFPMNIQEQKLIDNFEQWKGSQLQMDDILVIGFRF